MACPQTLHHLGTRTSRHAGCARHMDNIISFNLIFGFLIMKSIQLGAIDSHCYLLYIGFRSEPIRFEYPVRIRQDPFSMKTLLHYAMSA